MALIIDTSQTRELIDMSQALQAVESVFRDRAEGKLRSLPRCRFHAGRRNLNIMAASHEIWNLVCLRVYGGGSNTINLYDNRTGEMLAVVNMRYLSSLRTGAASGVAARYLAPENVETLGIIGTGRQAGFQAEAITQALPVKRVLVFGRQGERCQEFVKEMSLRIPSACQRAESIAEVESGADILVLATNSSTPLIEGLHLPGQVLIISIGANGKDKHEVSGKLINDMDLIVTDNLAAARSGSGDLIAACGSGFVAWEEVLPLERIVFEGVPQPRPRKILFQSNGIADEDLAVGRHVFERAKEKKLELTNVAAI